MQQIFQILKARGLLENITGEEIYKLGDTPLKVYAGFDPTADSLHLGNLVGIVVLGWFQRCGHIPYAIVGGATGMIGDPSGKSAERNLLNQETIEKNLQGIARSLSTVLHFGEKGVLLNNYAWFKGFSYLEFLRDVGKFFRLGTMIAKDSVKSRLASEEGISYTEFSYQLLQAYDFMYLFDHHGVTLQIGGSDQWGNITAGTELIRKARGKNAFGLTFPLLTRADGKKFGKTEEGTIWLNPDKLSAYDFYQYVYRTSDADVIKLMRMLTYMELEEIEAYARTLHEPNVAQKRLAEELTRLIHGEAGLKSALTITSQAQPGAKTVLDAATLETLSQEIPTHTLAESDIVDVKLVDFLAKWQIIPSKSEARRLISSGGVYLNNEKISDEQKLLKKSDIISEKYLLLGIGKKKKILIKIAFG